MQTPWGDITHTVRKQNKEEGKVGRCSSIIPLLSSAGEEKKPVLLFASMVMRPGSKDPLKACKKPVISQTAVGMPYHQVCPPDQEASPAQQKQAGKTDLGQWFFLTWR